MNKTLLLITLSCITQIIIASEPATRLTSGEILNKSRFIHSSSIGEPAIIGQIYDLFIEEENNEPIKIVAYSDKEFEITILFKLLLEGTAFGKVIPYGKAIIKPAPRTYTAMSSQNNWRVVVRNRDEDGKELPQLTLEIYKNIYKTELYQ